ncbi:MAG: ankyrin repeat domain-containing protein [Saprospiraceae bacterium]
MTSKIDHIPALKILLQERDSDKLLAFLAENPSVVSQGDRNHTSGLLLIAYSHLPIVLEKAIALKPSFNLFEAATCGRLEQVKENLAGKTAEINSHASDGFTALSLAAFFSQLEVVKYLLEQGADPNIAAKNPSNIAPIHAAVAANHLGICELLVQHGANVNLSQTQGVRPLHAAAHRGNLAMVQLLVEAGAEVNAQMENGDTALDFAEKDGHEEVKQYLRVFPDH